jgi:hypothetical protein
VSQEDTAAILGTIFAENSTFADTSRNGELIAQFLVENHCEFTLENCRKAVQILSYPFDKLDRQKPPVPTPPGCRRASGAYRGSEARTTQFELQQMGVGACFKRAG